MGGLAALRTAITLGPARFAVRGAAVTLRATFALGPALFALLGATFAIRAALPLGLALADGARLHPLHRLTRCGLGRALAFHHGSEVVGQRQTFQFRARHLADILEIGAFVLGTEGDRDPALAGPRGAADAVDILLRHVGQLVIDHVADARNVDPARGHIGGDQDRHARLAELVERALALGLRLVAVDRIAFDPRLAQPLHHTVGTMLGAGEDQHPFDAARHRVTALEDHFEQAQLFVLLHHEQVLVDPLGRSAFGGDRNLHRIVAEPAYQFLDRLGHGGAEEQGLALLGGELADLAQGVDEAEVEHLISLVEHEDLDAREVERLLVDQIEQAARGGDENVGAAVELVAILAHRGAADDALHLEARKRAIILGAVGDLHREFAGRGQHQHPARLERDLLVGLAQAVNRREHESGGLAGAGLGDAEQVAALQDRRDRLFLDRGGNGVALHVEGLEHGLRQPEVSKSCHV